MNDRPGQDEPVEVVNASEEMLLRARGTVQRIEDRIRRVLRKHADSETQGPHSRMEEGDGAGPR